jgi:hypothetical protein
MEAIDIHAAAPPEAPDVPAGLPNVVLVAILAVPVVVAAVMLILG